MLRQKHWIAIALLLSGCGEVRTETDTVVVEKDHTYVLSLIVDMSSSFAKFMADDGQAYDAMTQVVDTYHSDRIGSSDQIIIATISGSKDGRVWQGTPQQMRNRFPNPKAFAEFLRKHSATPGSCVYSSIATTIDYVLSDSRVASRKASSAVFVLSDGMDNDKNQDDAKTHMMDTLRRYAQSGGAMCMYYVNKDIASEWDTTLQDAGVTNRVVAPDFVTPTIPHFDN